MSVMLYKHPGKHKLHNDMFDYIIVEEDNVQDSISDGWFKTTPEAKEASTLTASMPTREEMETKAKELNIKFPPNIKDETLLKKINEKVDELD